jgi:hypothetical protein
MRLLTKVFEALCKEAEFTREMLGSGQQRFAGLCVVRSVDKDLIIASPLILGTPKGPWDETFTHK